ncbi:MAG: hypothetical protein RLP44_13800 [Aggregatilineales bacterium]
MLPSQHWARNFRVEVDDIDYISHLLLEKETPLQTEELVLSIINHRLENELAALEERYEGTVVYDPSQSFNNGQRLVFPNLNYETAKVVGSRAGNNAEYGDFTVISVQFDENGKETRNFASELSASHKLSEENNDRASALMGTGQITEQEIVDNYGKEISAKLIERLQENQDIVFVARKWFPRDLILDVDEGHRNLAEAVLDMMGGGPITTEGIIEEIGGLGDYPMSLQVFSLNYSLNKDSRFEEVGPTGEVLWHLTRMAPAEVQKQPAALEYLPIDYNRDLLTRDMLNMEAEIDDELSQNDIEYTADSGKITLIYPHRRIGSLPLSSQVRHLFPTAQKTSRIWLKLIDGQDGEEYIGWVLPKERYVYGLGIFYAKHSLPIGASITVAKGSEPGSIIVDFEAYRPRSEWIRLITPKVDTILFENTKRAIGADYDDLMILGVDDLKTLDETIVTIQRHRRSLASLLSMIIPGLGKLTPQGTAHIKTIYSAVNVLRRCPPGPIMATLEANPDFESVGDHYWKLSAE